ncbi:MULTISPECIES: universal stress protein [unclassified Rhodococcus (in: high G+C Gram-positive bacteria)]|uniref:universal stress protein n=1 Tax=unclassified Rhodococcus (in: high G+C Gram-positive bacteria) TaxID=192944 RepID=UPI0033907E10
MDESAETRDNQAHTFEYGVDGPKAILVGIDGSDSAWRAAAYAAGLARRQDSLLVLAYVQQLFTTGWGQTGIPLVETGKQIAEELLAYIKESTTRMESIRWEFRTAQGDPYSGLVAIADELRVDAIVVGASEHAGHRIFGSVAVRLVKSGRWPVTVVP